MKQFPTVIERIIAATIEYLDHTSRLFFPLLKLQRKTIAWIIHNLSSLRAILRFYTREWRDKIIRDVR